MFAAQLFATEATTSSKYKAFWLLRGGNFGSVQRVRRNTLLIGSHSMSDNFFRTAENKKRGLKRDRGGTNDFFSRPDSCFGG